MNNKTTRQLTPYDTKVYFVPDTRALEQRRSQLQAINAQLDRINAQKKYIAALKLKGLQIGIIDITRIGILAITYLFITLHTSNLVTA
jgi:hypothetical protein